MGRAFGLVVGSAIALAAAAVLTCGGSSSNPDRACVPGASVACVGPGGCAGFQVCKEDGSALGACACAGVAEAAEGSAAPTPDADGAVWPDAPVDASGDLASQDASSEGTGAPEAGDAGASTEGGSGTCMTGMYQGTFACTLMLTGDAAAPDASSFTVTGTVSFDLAPPDSGSPVVEMATGTFSGACCLGSLNLSATLSGSTNCHSGTFSGQLTNGMYAGSGIYALFFSSGTFSSPLTANYDGSHFVNGTWQMTIPGVGTCPGTWTASYSGP